MYSPKTSELCVRWLLHGLKPMLPVQIMHEHMMQIGHAHWLHSGTRFIISDHIFTKYWKFNNILIPLLSPSRCSTVSTLSAPPRTWRPARARRQTWRTTFQRPLRAPPCACAPPPPTTARGSRPAPCRRSKLPPLRRRPGVRRLRAREGRLRARERRQDYENNFKQLWE